MINPSETDEYDHYTQLEDTVLERLRDIDAMSKETTDEETDTEDYKLQLIALLCTHQQFKSCPAPLDKFWSYEAASKKWFST
jgi:hypothetical protein